MAFKDRMEGTESEVPVCPGQKTDASRPVSCQTYDGYDAYHIYKIVISLFWLMLLR